MNYMVFEALPAEYRRRGMTRMREFVTTGAELLLNQFLPRLSTYARRVSAERARATGIQRGIYLPVGPKERRQRLTVEALERHVGGEEMIGVYPLDWGGETNTITLDFDSHRGQETVTADPRIDYEAVEARLRELGVVSLGNRSRGGKGYHLHLFLPFRTSAGDARRFMAWILKESGVRHITEGGTFDSMFPKQDDRSEYDGPGNLFGLPMNLNFMLMKVPGTYFVGVDPRDLDGQLARLRDAQRISPERWKELMALVPTEVSPANSGAPSSANRRPAMGSSDRPSPTAPSAWMLALVQAGRLGRYLGQGKYAVLCLNDAAHGRPDRVVAAAQGSCVLFPPTDGRNLGWPKCSHAHCVKLTLKDWIAAVGPGVWEEAVRLAQKGVSRG